MLSLHNCVEANFISKYLKVGVGNCLPVKLNCIRCWKISKCSKNSVDEISRFCFTDLLDKL